MSKNIWVFPLGVSEVSLPPAVVISLSRDIQLHKNKLPGCFRINRVFANVTISSHLVSEEFKKQNGNFNSICHEGGGGGGDLGCH